MLRTWKKSRRPKYSSMMIRFSLSLRYSSCQTYKLLLEQLPLTSLSLLKKLSFGTVDSMKVANLLLGKNCNVSSYCILLVDGIYFLKACSLS